MKQGLAAGALLTAVFFATRLPNLLILPVFVDEAIQIEWAQRTALTGRLTGITDGSRYLSVWLAATVVPFASDPLWAARFLSILYGLGTLLGLVWLGRLSGDRAAGWLAACLYVVVPFAFFHDRLAVADPLLSLLLVLALASSLRWAATGAARWALAVGMLVGLGGVTKLNGIWLLLVPVMCLYARPTNRKALLWQLQWIVCLALLVMLPVFHDLPRNLQYVQDNAWVFRDGRHGTAPLLHNAGLAAIWLTQYLTPTVAVLAAAAGALALGGRDRVDRILVAIASAWIVLLVVTGGVDWFPRYLLPTMPPLLLLVARRVCRIGRGVEASAGWARAGRWLPHALGAAVTLGALPFDRALLTDPVAAPLPGIDRWQYIEDWPSGYGVAALAETLVSLDNARPGGVLIIRDSWSGPLYESLSLLLPKPRPEMATAAFRYHALQGVIERAVADPRTVLLILEQPTRCELVLDAAAEKVVAPSRRWPKPSLRREIELYVVRGEALPPAGDPPTLRLPEPASEADGRRVRARLARCLGEGGEESRDACVEALASLSGESRAEALYTLGRLLVAERRYEDALTALREADRIVPYDGEQTEALGDALERLGRHAEALETWDHAERAGSAAVLVENHRGWNLAMLGRWGEAEAAFRRSLEVQTSMGVLDNLAVVLWLQGRSDEARAVFAKAQSADAEALRLRYNAAVVGAARARRRP